MKRTLVIGDIHGGLKALIQVLERAKVTPNDTLIFLGDYVDGWSESAPTIQYLIELSERQECIFIKGNHDVWCEDYLRNGEADKTLAYSMEESHNSSKVMYYYPKMIRKEHLNFFERMKLCTM